MNDTLDLTGGLNLGGGILRNRSVISVYDHSPPPLCLANYDKNQIWTLLHVRTVS